jgi:hypothetical protein
MSQLQYATFTRQIFYLPLRNDKPDDGVEVSCFADSEPGVFTESPLKGVFEEEGAPNEKGDFALNGFEDAGPPNGLVEEAPNADDEEPKVDGLAEEEPNVDDEEPKVVGVEAVEAVEAVPPKVKGLAFVGLEPTAPKIEGLAFVELEVAPKVKGLDPIGLRADKVSAADSHGTSLSSLIFPQFVTITIFSGTCFLFVGIFSIFSMISIPSNTSPKTTCFPSRWEIARRVKKN